MSCTHCGLCLESCPTYTLWGTEADSPRGRIVLIEDALAPGGSATADMAAHIDSCLGCMACMSVCPEDVAFADLLASARGAIERQVQRPAGERLRRSGALAALPRMGRVSRLSRQAPLPHYTPARGSSRGRVGLLLGCTERADYRELHETTLAVLSAEGYEVIAPRLPDCCGAFELYSGEREHGLRRAQATIDAFAAVGGVDQIVTSAGGCGVALKDYGRLLGTPDARAFSALAVDVHELLTSAPMRSLVGPLAVRIAYHDACRLRHGQGIAEPPRELLRRIPGVELVELPIEAGACCGAPGIYRVTQPDAAVALARRQAAAIVATGAEMVVTGDHACIGQLNRQLRELGRPLAVHHPIEVLARAIDAGRRALN
ncbi:MAG TPA: (Fe-S)-binding protein [Solirubrobacteraceae bacterium]|jgi:glycolate oxidase iron-sulfur subunit|nr:(Fe-S)-binding protein [Solirubrobacteraceae bacterium]